MRTTNYNILIVYQVLLSVTVNNKEIDSGDGCVPKCEPRLINQKNEYDYPFVAMVIYATTTTISSSTVVALGTVISTKWLLTKSTAFKSRKKVVAVGLGRTEVPADLKGVAKIPLLWIVRNPLYEKTKTCGNNIALLRLETESYVPNVMVYWWLRPSENQREIRNIENIYWAYSSVKKSYEKYTMPWCPHFTTKYTSCKNKQPMEVTCVKAVLPKHGLYPTAQSTVSVGGPVMIEHEFHGIYLGMGPSSIKRAIKPNEHTAARVLARTSTFPDLEENAIWIENVIAGDLFGEPFDDTEVITEPPITEKPLSTPSKEKTPSATTSRTDITPITSSVNQTTTNGTNVTNVTPPSGSKETTKTIRTTGGGNEITTSDDGKGTKTTKDDEHDITTELIVPGNKTTASQNFTPFTIDMSTTKPDWGKYICQMFADKSSKKQISSILLLVLLIFLQFV